MIAFPYGTSDFYVLRSQPYYYVDRTHHIPLLESLGQALVFFRPRRFGKSLWLSTLENYYDVKKADEFDHLFGDLAIEHNPTPLHNHCIILYWNFSAVDTIGDIQTIKTALYTLLNQSVRAFNIRYNEVGYCDLVILVQPVHRHSHLQDFLFEFKYLSLDTLHRTGQQLRDMDRPTAAALPPVQTALAKAESALVRYRQALQAEHQHTLRLRCYAVVGLGREKLVWREIADAG